MSNIFQHQNMITNHHRFCMYSWIRCYRCNMRRAIKSSICFLWLVKWLRIWLCRRRNCRKRLTRRHEKFEKQLKDIVEVVRRSRKRGEAGEQGQLFSDIEKLSLSRRIVDVLLWANSGFSHRLDKIRRRPRLQPYRLAQVLVDLGPK